jgi:ATP-dependent DNA helicase HFM1/MER3
MYNINTCSRCKLPCSFGSNNGNNVIVINKNKSSFKGSGFKELNQLLLLQMIGRAGRPQFDDSGVAVIMTQNSTVDLYDNMINNKQDVESK